MQFVAELILSFTAATLGKGIALQFSKKFPEMLDDYWKACESGQLRLGTMHVFERNELLNPRYIINFPTKGHWRSRSRLKDIKDGLAALVEEVRNRNIHSIAVPPLGCGNGGLEWSEVRPVIESALAPLSDVRVLLYPPLMTR